MIGRKEVSRVENWVVSVPEIDTVDTGNMAIETLPFNSYEVEAPSSSVEQKDIVSRGTGLGQNSEKNYAPKYRSKQAPKSIMKPIFSGNANSSASGDDFTYQWSSISLAISIMLGLAAAAFGGVVLYAAAGAFGLLGSILAYIYWTEQSDDHAWYTTLFLMLAGLVAGIGFLVVLF